MQKIAILSLDPRNGGGILSSLKALYNFLSQKYEVTVFFLNFDPAYSTSIKRLKFTSHDQSMILFGMNCFAIGARWAFWEPGHYFNTLGSWLELNNYDLFFVSSGTPFAAQPLVFLNKKFILWVATPFWEDRVDRISSGGWIEKFLSWISKSRLEKIEREILEKATSILPMSAYASEQFCKILGYDKSMTVCGYPIDIAPAQATNKDYSKKIVVATGRFTDPRKNLRMLLKAWELIEQKHSDAVLIIIGTVPKDLKEQLRKSSSVFVAENISNDEKFLVYRQASLALITSWQEGLGIVGLEALSNAVPLVSTDCYGVRDFVVPNKTGVLVAVNDHVAMAHEASRLLEDSCLLEKMGKEGLALILQKYQTKVIVSIWQDALEVLD